jgi:hypothetical protein
VKLLSKLKFFKIHLLELFLISCAHEIACDAYSDIVGGKWGIISCNRPQRVEKLKTNKSKNLDEKIF